MCLMFLFLRGDLFRILSPELFSGISSQDIVFRISLVGLVYYCHRLLLFTSCMLYCCGRAFASSNPCVFSGSYVWERVLGF